MNTLKMTTEEKRKQLLHAAFKGDFEGVRDVLDWHAEDISAKDKCQALIYAAMENHEKIAEYLVIDEGADVNANPRGNYTPLMAASYEGNRKLVELLLNEGANVNVARDIGYTALMDAVTGKQEEAAERVINEDRPFIRDHEGVVGLLLDRGANIYAKDNQGTDAFQFAKQPGRRRIAALLLKAKKFPQNGGQASGRGVGGNQQGICG